MADVVERLRERWEATDAPVAKKINRLLSMCKEAATEIETLRARLSQAGAGGVDAGEPFGWVVGPVFFEEDPGALLGKRAVFVATPPAPVQTASVEAVTQALLDLCDAWDDKNGGGKYRGNVTNAQQAARAVLASLTAPTQGVPTPSSPVSSPSPAGGVREAIARIIDPHSFVPYEPTGAADDAVFADMVKSSLEDAYRKADRILALSSPATPEPVSAPAGEVRTANCCHCGRIVDTREKAEGGDDFGCQFSDGRWTCSPECWDAVTEPAALSNAPGQEVAPVAEPWFCGGCGQTDPAKRCLGCLHGLSHPTGDKEGRS